MRLNLKKIGEALKNIAPTIAGTLISGNPASGAILGELISDLLGINKDDPKATDKILAKFSDPVEIERIRADLEKAELTHAQAMARIALEWHQVDAETDRDNYAQTQQSYRSELSTDDSLVRRTRPLIVRGVFLLVCVMILFLMVAAIADYLIDQRLIRYCLENAHYPCDFNRVRYTTIVGNTYAENWGWLSLVVSILPAYWGSRGFEKLQNKDDTLISSMPPALPPRLTPQTSPPTAGHEMPVGWNP